MLTVEFGKKKYAHLRFREQAEVLNQDLHGNGGKEGPLPFSIAPICSISISLLAA